jgi:hypothetical protein
MQQCPSCQSDRIHYSRTKGVWESWRKQITGKRPHRCRQCGWRGWAADSGPHFTRDEIDNASRAVAPDPPNLKETMLAREDRVPASVDLHDIDATMARDREPPLG